MFDFHVLHVALAALATAVEHTGPGPAPPSHAALLRQEPSADDKAFLELPANPNGGYQMGPMGPPPPIAMSPMGGVPGGGPVLMPPLPQGGYGPMQPGPGPGMPMVSSGLAGRQGGSLDTAPAMPGDPFAGAACVVPMWNKKEFLCEEHVEVPEDETFTDFNDIKRKKLHDGSSCTTQCPHARWWQVATQDVLTCRDGRWRDDTGRPAQELVCDTSNVFYFTTLLVIILIALLCTPGGRKSFRQARQAGTTAAAPKMEPGAEKKDEDGKKAEDKEGDAQDKPEGPK